MINAAVLVQLLQCPVITLPAGSACWQSCLLSPVPSLTCCSIFDLNSGMRMCRSKISHRHMSPWGHKREGRGQKGGGSI